MFVQKKTYLALKEQNAALERKYKALMDHASALKTKLEPFDSVEAAVDAERKKLAAVKIQYSDSRKLLTRLAEQVDLYNEKWFDHYDALSNFEEYEGNTSFLSDQVKKEKSAIRKLLTRMKNPKNDEQILEMPHGFGPGSYGASDGDSETVIAYKNGFLQATRDASQYNSEVLVGFFTIGFDDAMRRMNINNLEQTKRRIEDAAESVKLYRVIPNGKPTSTESWVRAYTSGISNEETYFNAELLERCLLYAELQHQLMVAKAQEKERVKEAKRVEREQILAQKALDQAIKDEATAEEQLRERQFAAQQLAGAELEKMRSEIESLEAALAAVRTEKERAKAMAELTRAGYVYIITNVGSFGEGVVKIGMTRRVDPNKRVKELGDASVPFLFDTHALIYSEDAPDLEAALHRRFEPGRVNKANSRKEFFRADIAEVKRAVEELAPDAVFIDDAIAADYYKSKHIESVASDLESLAKVDEFPETI